MLQHFVSLDHFSQIYTPTSVLLFINKYIYLRKYSYSMKCRENMLKSVITYKLLICILKSTLLSGDFSPASSDMFYPLITYRMY